MCFAVWHLINARERHQLVEHAAQHLVPGGRLLLDVAVEGGERAEQPRTLAAQRRLGDTTVRRYTTMRRAGQGRWLTTWELVTLRGDEAIDRVIRTFDWQPAAPAEVEAMLVQHGFAIEQRVADARGAPFGLGASRSLPFVARRL